MIDSSNTDCDRIRRALDDDLYGESDTANKGNIDNHLGTCTPCSEMFEQRLLLKRLVRRAVRSEAASETLKQKIREMIRAS